MNYFIQFWEALVTLTNDMSPYLLLGFLIAGVLHVFVKKEKITRYLGKKNIKSVFLASLFGVPLPLCSCGVIPTGVSFYKDGASKGATVSFLISTPQTGVDSMLVTYSMMGLPFAILRPIIAFITGIFGGLLTNFMDKDNVKNNATDTYKGLSVACDGTCHTPSNSNTDSPDHVGGNKFFSVFSYAFGDFMEDIAKWLVIGLLLAAAISAFVPNDFFTLYLDNPIWSMLAVLLVAVPLYVCATSSVPIAVVLLMKGISPGAALVFLMAGPATNAATITVLGKTLGKKALFAYLASIILGALFFGIFIDYFLPKEWFLGFLQTAHIQHQHSFISPWISYGSSFLLLALLLRVFYKKYQLSKNPPMSSHLILDVQGMSCNHCKNQVEKTLKNMPEITQVVANPTNNTVLLDGHHINLEEVTTRIAALGFECKGIKK